jgi:hypothetical protein
MIVYRTSLIRKRSSARTSAPARRSTAGKYRNRDGSQRTSADFDGRTASLRTRVFERRFDVSSRWHAEGQGPNLLAPPESCEEASEQDEYGLANGLRSVTATARRKGPTWTGAWTGARGNPSAACALMALT